jgi:hypothetical protein
MMVLGRIRIGRVGRVDGQGLIVIWQIAGRHLEPRRMSLPCRLLRWHERNLATAHLVSAGLSKQKAGHRGWA